MATSSTRLVDLRPHTLLKTGVGGGERHELRRHVPRRRLFDGLHRRRVAHGPRRPPVPATRRCRRRRRRRRRCRRRRELHQRRRRVAPDRPELGPLRHRLGVALGKAGAALADVGLGDGPPLQLVFEEVELLQKVGVARGGRRGDPLRVVLAQRGVERAGGVSRRSSPHTRRGRPRSHASRHFEGRGFTLAGFNMSIR